MSDFAETTTPTTMLNEVTCESQFAPTRFAQYEQFERTKYFGSFDGVRGLCILAVIFHHIPLLEYLPRVFHLGFLGVDVFFVLSGVLIETLILRERSRTGSFSLTNFYMRRSLRIFPIYYLLLFSLLIALQVTKPHSETLDKYLYDFPYYLTYSCNWIMIVGVNMSVLWSLATEEQFYLIWPFIEKYLRPRLGFCLLILAFAINQMVNFGAFDGWLRRVYGPASSPFIYQITFTPIILGVVLGRLLHSPRAFAILARLIGSKLAPLGLAGLLLGGCCFAPSQLAGWPRLLIQMTMALLIGSLMIREDHFAARVLRWAPIRRLGVVSYGAYLYHMTAMYLVSEIFEHFGLVNPWITFGMTVLVTFGMAEVSYRIVETPLLHLKRVWSREGAGALVRFSAKMGYNYSKSRSPELGRGPLPDLGVATRPIATVAHSH